MSASLLRRLSFFPLSTSLLILATAGPMPAQAVVKYQLPSDVMVKLVDALPTPLLSLSLTTAAGPVGDLAQ